jgi:hypothetical protein
MTLEEVREAICKGDIDQLLSHAKYISEENAEEATKLYEEYYRKEENIAQTIQNIIAHTRISKSKTKIPDVGNYSYRLE